MAATDTQHVQPEVGPPSAPYDVAAAKLIHKGACLGLVGAAFRPLIGGDDFGGFSLQTKDNSDGDAGDKICDVLLAGVATLAVTGVVDDSDFKAVVYATADNAFTLTPGGGRTAIGKVKKVVSAGIAQVAFNALGLDPSTDVEAVLAHTEDVANPHVTSLALAATAGGFLVEALTGVGPWAQAEDSEVIILDAGDAETLTIASAVARAGRPLLIVKDNAADRIVTLAAAAGNINGAATFALPGGAQRVAVLLVSDGADWHVVSQGFGLAAVLAHVADVTTNPHGVTLEQASIGGGHKIAEISGVGPWAMADEDVDIIFIDAGDAETLTVPGAETRQGRPLIVQKTNADDRVVTLATDGASLINGAGTFAMASGAFRPQVILYSDGTNYWTPTAA